MGVQGLWQLLNSVGRPVTLESLENKILAVDVSIWLHQAVQGCKNPAGAPAQNAHLLTLFNRICKLLFYKIKPVFVFDGGIPLLKKQTVASRRQRKELARKEKHCTQQKLLRNIIKRDIVKRKLNSGSQEESQQTVEDILAVMESTKQPDLFQLADLPKETQNEFDKINQESSSEDSAQEIFQHYLSDRYQDMDSVDIHSESFRSLPLDIQHEMLSELKESRKRNSWAQMDEMPKESQNFSSFQMARLMKKRSLQQKLEDVEKQMKSAEIDYFQPGLDENIAVTSRRIISEEGTHYILTKNTRKTQFTSDKISTTVRTQEKREKQVETVVKTSLDIDIDDIVSSSSNDSVEIMQRIVESHSKKQISKSEKNFGHLNSLREKLPSFNFSCENVTTSKPVNDSPVQLSENENSIEDNFDALKNRTLEDDINEIQSNQVTNFDGNKNEICTPSTSQTSEQLTIIRSPSKTVNINEEPKTKEFTRLIQHSSDHDSTDDSDFIEVSSLVEVDSDSSISDTKQTNENETRGELLHESEERALNVENLEALEKDLDAENASLQKEMAKADAAAKSLTDQTYGECQELLQLFGIPYITSPMEAEAQCAKLDALKLTHGTITDDSDVWLFGGERVYRNFFNQSKFVEFFKAEDIKEHFNLDRLKLICLALMTGSDYTDGIEGVGCVTAMEILSEFSDEGLDCLKAFKKWWEENKNLNLPADTPVKKKLRKLILPPGFPNDTIANAYLDPSVDDSKEKFSWSMPDLAGLREYAQFRFGWPRLKSDSFLLPVLKKLNENETQTRLDSYFKVTIKKDAPTLSSKRLKRAIRKVTRKNSPEVVEDPKEKAVAVLRRKMRDAGESSLGTKRKAKQKQPKEKKRKKIPSTVVNLSEDSSD